VDNNWGSFMGRMPFVSPHNIIKALNENERTDVDQGKSPTGVIVLL